MKKLSVRRKSGQVIEINNNTTKVNTELVKDDSVEIKQPTILDIGKSILTGAYNMYKNNNESLAKARLDVCNTCPLIRGSGSTIRCNSNKSILRRTLLEPTIENIEKVKKENNGKFNIVSGCGCSLKSKSTVIGDGNTCPANNWDKVDAAFLCMPNLQLLDTSATTEINMQLLYRLISEFGITSAAYTLKQVLKPKLINHNILLALRYTITEVHTDHTITYSYSKFNITAKLNSYLDGTYSLYYHDKLIISREDSKQIKITNLYKMLEI